MRVNNWLSGFACVLLLGVVGCKKDKIREGIPVVVEKVGVDDVEIFGDYVCLLYTSPSPRDTERSRMPSSA